MKLNRVHTSICSDRIRIRITGLIMFVLFAYLPLTAQSQQTTLTGKILTEKGLPLRYANVALIKTSDSSLSAGAVTGAAGEFSVTANMPGNYFLRVTSLGFLELRSDVFTIGAGSSTKEMGILQLREDIKQLNDVTVKSIQPTITQLADRMVVNVDGTVMAAGRTAYEVLARTPGVFIDHSGTIQLNGKGGVSVMLNGKLTYLSANDLRNMLEAMPASNIKNIEIITNPSSKYDAEGSSGILNINLKKNDRQGINGTINSSYSYNGKQSNYAAGANINYKNGKWNSFVNTNFSRRAGGRDATFTRVFYGSQKTTYFDQLALGDYTAIGPPSVRFGADYDLNDNHNIGFTGSFNSNRSEEAFLTSTYIGSAAGKPSQFIDARNYTGNQYTGYSGNLHYSGKLDTSGTTLSADLDYVKIRNRSLGDFNNYFTELANNSVTKDVLFTEIPNGYDIYAAKIDFATQLTKTQKLELGAKASRVVSDNDARFYFNNNGLVLDPLRTNHFLYEEVILAAYANWSGSLNKNVLLQFGLRAENTSSTGTQLTSGQVTDRNYLNLFPTAFVQQKISEDYQVNYSYSRRIQRPNYGVLNPFRAYRDPYTWYEGNPYLRAQYTHAISITQTFRKKYYLIFNYQANNDAIAELPMLDVNNAVTVYYNGNVGKSYTIGLTAIAPIRISKNWETNNTGVLSYSNLKVFTNNLLVVNDQLFYMLQSAHTIVLPREIRGELTMAYRGPAASGLYHIKPMSWVNIGIRKSLFNKKLDVTVSATDIFKNQRLRFTTGIGQNINEFDQYFRNQTVALSLRYSFSKGLKADMKKRNNNLDEVNRAGGN